MSLDALPEGLVDELVEGLDDEEVDGLVESLPLLDMPPALPPLLGVSLPPPEVPPEAPELPPDVPPGAAPGVVLPVVPDPLVPLPPVLPVVPLLAVLPLGVLGVVLELALELELSLGGVVVLALGEVVLELELELGGVVVLALGEVVLELELELLSDGAVDATGGGLVVVLDEDAVDASSSRPHAAVATIAPESNKATMGRRERFGCCMSFSSWVERVPIAGRHVPCPKRARSTRRPSRQASIIRAETAGTALELALRGLAGPSVEERTPEIFPSAAASPSAPRRRPRSG